jgi:hypothetical protein
MGLPVVQIVALNGGMIGELWLGKDLEGSSHGLDEVLS